MIDQAADALDAVRARTNELLASIDAWRACTTDPENFRHRLLRAHALAVLDEIDQLSEGRHGAPG